MTSLSVSVVGGAGHVGLPLSIMLASKGVRTTIVDLDTNANEIISSGEMPFLEPGAEDLLKKSLASGMLSSTDRPDTVSDSDIVIFVIGTPVDEHLNPDPGELPAVIRNYCKHLRDGQLVVLRSTIFPGVTRLVDKVLKSAGLDIDLAFCPERIAEHNAVEELTKLPQIVSATSDRAERRAKELFEIMTPTICLATPEEAELAKLFTNTWRYIKFAAANQLYMMSAARGLDFEKIREVITHDYPRAADLPSAGFAAGPCLLKDTMQLAAFSDNTFVLGHSAMMVNEGLPLFLVTQLEGKFNLSEMRVGILGMAFKASSDDIRSSLSYKLKNVLEYRALEVRATDPYVREATDSRLMSLEDVINNSDILIIATPHDQYVNLPTTMPILDIWGISKNLSSFR